MTPAERASVEYGDTFRNLSLEAQAHVLRVRDDVDELDEQADLLLAQQREDEWLSEQSAEGDAHDDDLEDPIGELRADQLEAESDAVFGAWSDETMSFEEALGIVEPGGGEESLSEQVGWPEDFE
jgi:hypothetical protein